MKYFLRCIIPAFLVVIATMFSCKQEDCVTSANNYLLVDFFKSDTLETGEVKFTAKDTLFFSVTAVGNDSVFYSKKKKVRSISLPVNPAADQTTFKFVMIDSIRIVAKDTMYYLNKTPHEISVSYKRGYRIITEECGIEISYNNLVLDTITFSSDSLINDNLSRFNETNLEIYF